MASTSYELRSSTPPEIQRNGGPEKYSGEFNLSTLAYIPGEASENHDKHLK